MHACIHVCMYMYVYTYYIYIYIHSMPHAQHGWTSLSSQRRDLMHLLYLLHISAYVAPATAASPPSTPKRFVVLYLDGGTSDWAWDEASPARTLSESACSFLEAKCLNIEELFKRILGFRVLPAILWQLSRVSWLSSLALETLGTHGSCTPSFHLQELLIDLGRLLWVPRFPKHMD